MNTVRIMGTVRFDQVVLYENDALVASYEDGSGIELSPCATCFVFHHAQRSDVHCIHGKQSWF